MTGVSTDTATSGTVKYLLSKSSVTNLVGVFPNTTIPYIFTNVPQHEMKNSSTSALVVNTRGQWISANNYNTARYPRVQIDFYVDPIRDLDGNIALDNNEVER